MNDGERAVLQDLLTRWYDAAERGTPLSIPELCAEHPELEVHVRRVLASDADFAATLGATRAASEPSPQQRRVDDYEILTLLGTGGRGEVYLARQASLGRFVAVKFLRSESSRDAHMLARFAREAELAASLEHPNIVPIYGVGKGEGTSYLVMKWLTGPALDDLEKPLPHRRILEIGIAIARALHAAHEAGITHRDVKPANIMLHDDTPYVLDFGLARATTDMRATIEGKVAGTLPYMSPEQLCSGSKAAPLDGRTDVYSLGVTLYELFEGHPPFASDEPAPLIQKILLTTAPLASSCSKDIRTILARALEKDPARRFASAAALADDLERTLRGEPIESRPVGAFERLRMLARRHPMGSAALGVAATTLLVMGGVMWAKAQNEWAAHRAALHNVERELASSRPRVATGLLDAIAERHPDDPAVHGLRDEIRAETRLSELTDYLQQARGSIDGQRVLADIAAIEELTAFTSRPERAREWRLVKACALALAGHRDLCRVALEQDIDPRAKHALEALLEQRDWPWQLPTSARPTAIGHLVTAIAMRAADGPADAQLDEIRRGLELDETDERLGLQELIWLSIHTDEAERVLTALSRIHPEHHYSKAVRGAMLREATKIGDPRRIEDALNALERDYPRDTWNEIQASIVAAAYEAMRRHDELSDLLAWARKRWPKNWFLEMSEAKQKIDHGDHAAGSQLLRAAAADANTRSQRDATQTVALRLRLHELEYTIGGAAAVDIDALAADALELARMARSPRQRAAAYSIAANAIMLAADADTEKALSYLKNALESVKSKETLLRAAQFAQVDRQWAKSARFLDLYEALFGSDGSRTSAERLEFSVLRAYQERATGNAEASTLAARDALQLAKDAELAPEHEAALLQILQADGK